jgi:16S rRNA (cytosine1402-N4)-methyltransferase
MLMPATISGGREDLMTEDFSGHVPVLLHEAVEGLNPRPGGVYVDGTFGAGGHSRLLASRIGVEGVILAFDRDASARARAEALARESGSTVRFAHASFADMDSVVHDLGYAEVDGVLLDLGISSLQLDDPERGFSFQREGALDMRLDPGAPLSAADLIANAGESELADILFSYGEERRSRRIAAAIVRQRAVAPITTTTRLAALVEKTIGRAPGARIHPATRTFQALRIAVNDELGELERGLEATFRILAPYGRLVAISFHSLEDRIVKQFIAREAKGCICPPEQPVCTCGRQPTLKPVGRAVRPADAEVALNPRARSATMRIAERLP